MACNIDVLSILAFAEGILRQSWVQSALDDEKFERTFPGVIAETRYESTGRAFLQASCEPVMICCR